MSSTQAAGERIAQQGAAASTRREAGCTARHHTCIWMSASWSECWLLSPHSLENEQVSFNTHCTSIWASVMNIHSGTCDLTHAVLCTYRRLYIGPAVLLCLVWCPSLQPGPRGHKSNHSLLSGGCQWTQSRRPVDKWITYHPSSTMNFLM